MWHFMMQCIQLLSHMSHMNLTGEAEDGWADSRSRAEARRSEEARTNFMLELKRRRSIDVTMEGTLNTGVTLERIP